MKYNPASKSDTFIDIILSYLRNSEIFEVVGRKGVYRCAGIGGGITGMGGHICFPRGTNVLTRSGNTDISSLSIGDEVNLVS